MHNLKSWFSRALVNDVIFEFDIFPDLCTFFIPDRFSIYCQEFERSLNILCAPEQIEISMWCHFISVLFIAFSWERKLKRSLWNAFSFRRKIFATWKRISWEDVLAAFFILLFLFLIWSFKRSSSSPLVSCALLVLGKFT